MKITGLLILITIAISVMMMFVIVSTAEEQEIGTWKHNTFFILQIKKLFNNVWGAGDAEKTSGTLKSYIYYKSNGNFGWEWSRSNPLPNPNIILPLYPAVIVKNTNNFSYFPKLKYVNTLKADLGYEYVKYPTGSYNFAYDIWFKDGKNRIAEIMIWMDCTSCIPGAYRGDVNDGYNTYALYYKPSNKNRPWPYYAYVLKNKNKSKSIQSHSVNMKILLDKLVQSGDLSTEWDLYSIELGNEVWKGSGRTEIDNYKININGISVDITGDNAFVIPIQPGPTPIQSPGITPIQSPGPIQNTGPIKVNCYKITKK